MTKTPIYFATLPDWRSWLEKHHADATEVWVGFYKRDSGRASITWTEAVDGALCFGWIDGVRHSVDSARYKVRFTRRGPRSVWSAVNIKRAKELSKLNLMHPAGLSAFQKRTSDQTAQYSYEQRMTATLPAAYQKQFRANAAAWAYFSAQAPWYRRTAAWWIISAKKEETQLKRLALLIACSEKQQLLPAVQRPSTKK